MQGAHKGWLGQRWQMWQMLGTECGGFNMPRIGKTLPRFGLKRSAMFTKGAVSIIGAMSEPSSLDLPPSLDPVASARWAAWPHVASPWLNEEIGRRMEDRLQWIRMSPKLWVDWAPVSGGLTTHKQLRARYPQSHCHVIEPTSARDGLARQALQAPWWKRWLQSNALSFGAPAAGSADILWANMALHTSADPHALLRKWHQLLAVDGFLMFSCLGPDTLRELDEVYQSQGWPPASHAFTDMHDWGDMLVHAGFAEPVMDMERITLTYATAESLLAEFRALGRNLHRDRCSSLRGKQWLAQLKSALLLLAKPQQNGRLSLTVEVIYGHALKPLPRLQVQHHSSVSLQDMRTLLGQSPRGRSV
jgi:malonyl-CoA O-methyltransferase